MPCVPPFGSSVQSTVGIPNKQRIMTDANRLRYAFLLNRTTIAVSQRCVSGTQKMNTGPFVSMPVLLHCVESEHLRQACERE